MDEKYINGVMDDLATQRDNALRSLGKVEGALNLCNHFLAKLSSDQEKEAAAKAEAKAKRKTKGKGKK